MFINRHARPLALLVGASLALSIPVGAAHGAKSDTAKTSVTAAKAKAKAKSKAKAKTKAKTKAKVKTKTATGRPDLATKAIHVDVSEDGTLLIGANLVNLGRKVAGANTVVIALSDDRKFDEDDEVLTEVDAPAIGPGVKRSVSEEVAIPGDLDTTEEFTILVCADGYNTVSESNETNNCVSQALVIDDVAGSDDSGSDDEPGDDSAPADEA